jgi:N-acetylmuramoyl-L-alanine amidase
MSQAAKFVLVGALLLVMVYYATAPQTASTTTDAGTAGGLDLGNAYGNSGTAYGSQYAGGTYSQGQPNYTPGTYVQGGQSGGVAVSDPGGDVDTFARVLYGEARGAGAAAMQGVASVVMNRVNTIGLSFGQLGGVSGVCLAPLQFTCMSAQYGGSDYTATMNVQVGDPSFDACLTMAGNAMNGELPDNTGGATYYYDTSISRPSFWAADGINQTVQIGTLVFGAKPSIF